MGRGNNHVKTKFKKWLKSYGDVSGWIEKKCPDLDQLLEEHGGLVKIENFLPTFVADGILGILAGIDQETWNLTSAQDDYVHNNIRHNFLSVKQGPPELEDVFRLFTLLLPGSLFTFSAAKYCKNGHIVPHDDRAYTNVLMEDGSVQLCSRNIACIYYLTKDWAETDGGQLVDLEAAGGPQAHVPKYNSLILFTIPRWHEVKPVTGNRPRYSVFGWFLEPGMLYELNGGEDKATQQQEQQLEEVAGDSAEPQDEIQRRQQQQQQQHMQAQQRHRSCRPHKNCKEASTSTPHQQVQSHLQLSNVQQGLQLAGVRSKQQKRKRVKESGTAGEVVRSLAVPEHSSHMPKQKTIKKKKHNGPRPGALGELQ